jgi:hypothetical protein
MKSKTFYKRLVFPVLGLGALIWFLIRIIPKPMRASYPCMRIAAPIASSFVCWIIAAIASVTAFRKASNYFRQSRYIIAVLCLSAGLVTAVMLLNFSDRPAYGFALAQAQEPNNPIGESRGINPGRVVWVHEPDATDWETTSQEHWWETGHTDQELVEQMLSLAVCGLSGEATDAEAWDALITHFNQTHGRGDVGYTAGEKFMIKVNLVGCIYTGRNVNSNSYELERNLDYMNTSPQVMLALLRDLINVVGVEEADITIGDPLCRFANQYYDILHDEFPNVNYLDQPGEFGRRGAEASAVPFYWSHKPQGVIQDYVLTSYVEAGYLINLANLKSHSGAGVTLCAKNHYGSLRIPTEDGYYNMHYDLPSQVSENGNYRNLVDLMGHAHVGGKTLLYLIDGLYAGVHPDDSEPLKWDLSPFNGDWTSSIFASQDGVAIDCVAFDFLQEEGDDRAYPQMAGTEDYLLEAAQAANPPSGTFYDPHNPGDVTRLSSLGVHEHWNNSTDKQYSRNLGTGDGIELIAIQGVSTPIVRESLKADSPVACRLHQNYPNPFTNQTTIQFSIKDNATVLLEVYNAQGKNVRSLISGIHEAGSYEIIWEGKSNSGELLPSGTYHVVLTSISEGRLEKREKEAFLIR